MAQGQEEKVQVIQAEVHTLEEARLERTGNPPGGDRRTPPPPPQRTPPQQSGGACPPGGTPSPPAGTPARSPAQRPIDPWAQLNRSRKSLPPLKLPSNYRTCSILDMRHLLEDWLSKSTFAMATWRGDAQRYWLEQVLETASRSWAPWRAGLRLRSSSLARTTPKRSPPPMMSTSMPVMAKSRREKVKVQKERGVLRIGHSRAVIIGDQTDAALDTTAQIPPVQTAGKMRNLWIHEALRISM